MIKVRVQSLGLDQNTKSPVVILQEEEGDRVLSLLNQIQIPPPSPDTNEEGTADARR